MSLAERKHLISATQSTCEIIEQNYNAKYTVTQSTCEIIEQNYNPKYTVTQSTCEIIF